MSPETASTDCASRLRILAEDTRLHVVRLLLEAPRHVGELQQTIGIEQSLLSHHLRILRDAGLVTAERDGKAVLYRVAPDVSVKRSGEAIHLGCCVVAFDD